MTDGEHSDPLRRWLADDLFVLNTVFLVAASALAIALTSCLWHHIHPEPSHTDSASSILAAALSFRVSPATKTHSDPPIEPKDQKSTRSKERRRRGKDPFRDLLKGGKKSKALFKTVKTADQDHASPPNATASTSSSMSRSPSPSPAGVLLDMPHLTESDDGSAGNTASSSNASTVTSSADISDHGSSDACSRADPVPPDSMTCADTQLNISSASTIMGHASEDVPSSPPVSTASADSYTPQPCNSQAVSMSGSCAKLVRARTRLRLSRIEQSVRSSPKSTTPSILSDSVATSLPTIHSNVPRSLPSAIQLTHSIDGAGPSTPTVSRGSTPLSRSSSPSEEPHAQPLNQGVVGSQLQLASMHSALEAARVREERLHVEIEQASKERDELRWRWNEEAGLWRRREAEFQTQIYHLMQQLQAYAAMASFQASQAPNSGFTSPTSPPHSSPLMQPPFPLPPPIQAQNSASAPAHVQALLASAPMLTCYPVGYSGPGCAGGYSGTDHAMSPLLWSGLGLCVPKREARHGGRRTPDSSASGSSSRDGGWRPRAESASDESSLGDWDGMDGGSGEDLWEEEEEEEVFRNNALADAILKRPESIRGLGGKRSGRGQDKVEKNGFTPPPAVRTVADAADTQ